MKDNLPRGARQCSLVQVTVPFPRDSASTSGARCLISRQSDRVFYCVHVPTAQIVGTSRMPQDSARAVGSLCQSRRLVGRALHFDARPCPFLRAAVLSIDPPIWQREYFDRYLRSEDNYSEKWDYVERNAVRAGLVMNVEDWPHRGIIHDLIM